MISFHMPDTRLAAHVLCHVARSGAPEHRHDTVFPASFYATLAITHSGGIIDMSTGRVYPRLALCGAQTRPKRLRYRPGTVATTTIFKPGRLTWLLDVPAGSTVDAVLDASSLIGQSHSDRLSALQSDRTQDRMVIDAIEAFLIERLAARTAPRRSFHVLLEQVMSRVPSMQVQELSRHFGLVPRSLQRRFRRELGMAPKTFGRLARLHETLWRIQTAPHTPHDWSDVATQSGFADQSHLHREFKALVGLSPSELIADLKRNEGPKWAFRLPPSAIDWCHADTQANSVD